MAFVLTPLTRPSSPIPRESRTHIGHEDEGPSTSSLPRVNSAPQLEEHQDAMGQHKERSHIQIHLDSQYLQLKGTGPDVEPTRLSGHVTLVLTEATSLKEVTLTFRGKARIPIPASESMINNGSLLTYVVCNHEWSFLEGDKRHSRTLKAGRHFFPFQLQIGGSLPSSVMSSCFGGASVAYKLRAQATRPGLMQNNMQAIEPVCIMRSFAHEALEYQQTLEIENTWPEKLMYSIMVPHKAWAAGDRLTAVVKFSPLSKGVVVLSVTSTIHETTKVYARSGSQEDTRIIATAKHEIMHGRAVEVDMRPQHSNGSSSNLHTPPNSAASPPSYVSSSHATNGVQTSEVSSSHEHLHSVISHPSSSRDSPPPNAIASSSSNPSPPPPQSIDEFYSEDNNDVVTYLSVTVPATATPTHALEPIIVHHRIRWSILILNMDGHTSELRCSLPLHILDHRLLDEARACTSATRRLILGGPEGPEEEEGDRELPSYTAHVRDRVANMFLPEAATMRVINPWVTTGTSPTHAEVHDPLGSWPHSRGRSGHSTPMETHLLSHLPHAPGSGDTTPLDWVNSELLLSLSENPPPALRRSSRTSGDSEHTPPPQQQHQETHQEGGSRPHSRWPSRPSSRTHSRTTSPERAAADASSSASIDSVGSVTPSVASPHETYVHHGHASRNLHSLFKATMKPFSSLSHPLGHHSHGFFSRHATPQSLTGATAPGQSSSSPNQLQSPRDQQVPRSLTLPLPSEESAPQLLHRAFTEVPDYTIASRGFIGGVPPLDSMRGLPSYEEASGENVRPTQSEGDLAAQFARAVAMNEGRRGVFDAANGVNGHGMMHSYSAGELEGLRMRERERERSGLREELQEPDEDEEEGSSESREQRADLNRRLPPPVPQAQAGFHL